MIQTTLIRIPPSAEFLYLMIYFIFILVSIISALHYFALANYWYFIFPWLDLIMHFLGGLFISLSVLFLFEIKRVYLISILSVLIVSIFWELFEHSLGVFKDDYVLDTVVDFIMGVLGAVGGGYIFSVVFKKL